MNRTAIEWTNFTWNPITGCLYDCPYCYAKVNYMRFHKQNEKKPYIMIDEELNQSFDPKFWGYRLEDKMPKKPSKIFVGSMGEMFGFLVPRDLIGKVLEVVKKYPQHTYQFLTKNPIRYLEFNFPKNVWLGTTIEKGSSDPSMKKRLDSIKLVKDSFPDLYVFVSAEPLLGKFEENDFAGIDLVIVGAMTGSSAVIPEKEWIESIKHKNIFYKANIKKYLNKKIK